MDSAASRAFHDVALTSSTEMAGTGDEIEAVLDMPSLPDLDESILVERRYRAGAEDSVAAGGQSGSGAAVAEAKETSEDAAMDAAMDAATDAAVEDAAMEDGAMEVANAVAAVEGEREDYEGGWEWGVGWATSLRSSPILRSSFNPP